MDLYAELGVSKTATQDEIKRSYKKLAMKHHPDRGGDADRLSKINAAYTVLKDPKKRAEYDNPSQFAGHNGFGFQYSQGPDLNNIFEEMFRRNHNHSGYYHRKNQDVRLQTVISLAECYTGKRFQAKFTLPNGQQESLEIDIPAGMKDGDVIRVPGLGDNSISNMPRGDAHIFVAVKPDPGWDIHGHDLITSSQVNILDLIIGTHVNMQTPNGKHIKLKIPAGTNPGSVLSITGYGLPIPRANRSGHIHVRIDPFVPKCEDESMIKKIKELRDEIGQIS